MTPAYTPLTANSGRFPSSANRGVLAAAVSAALLAHGLILSFVKFDATSFAPAQLPLTVSISLPPPPAPPPAEPAALDAAPAPVLPEPKPEPAPVPPPAEILPPPPPPPVIEKKPPPPAPIIRKPAPPREPPRHAQTKTEKPAAPAPKPVKPPKPPAAPAAPAQPPAEAQALPAPTPKLDAESLLQQIHSIGERERNRNMLAGQQGPKIKFAGSVTRHKYLAAQYVKDWDSKVERTGNLNYPAAARDSKEALTLTMDVGINADGSLYSMRIVKSSGNPALDEAAKRIVRMSAPFAELPVELLQEVDVLVITRVWQFSDETGMTTH